MRTLEEIVDDILVELHPLKDPDSDFKQSLIETVVSLRKMIPLWHKISLTKKREPAKKLSSAIAKLEKCLRETPAILIGPMFVDFHRDSAKIEDIQREIELRIMRFNEQLQKMRILCEFAVRVPDQDPRSSHEKIQCAEVAYNLMKNCSKSKITGTHSDRFFSVAGLLYEAVSGNADADMQRACDSALRSRKSPRRVRISEI